MRSLTVRLGGSPQPIASALRILRPDVVWFLVSDGKTGESSLSQVEDAEIDYAKDGAIRGPGLKFAGGCPGNAKTFPIPADDPDGAYKTCRLLLTDARKTYPNHQLVADYTGGTKSMSAALLMAALAQPGVEVQFMAGERADLARVKSGSEWPQRMGADFIMAERDFAAAEQAVAGYDYAAAQRLLADLSERLKNAAVTPPKSFRRRLEQASAWTGVMARWDAFSHREAARHARGSAWLRDVLAKSSHLEPLLDLGGQALGKPSWRLCADLWRNAERRGLRRRYDDAVARLYRLLEAAAQAHVSAKHGLDTGRLVPTELPESMRSSVIMKRDPKTGAAFAQLALNQTVQLLRERDSKDEFAAAYAGGGPDHRLQGPAWLVKRNHSILAHGFVTVDEKAWVEAKSWIETNLRPFFRTFEFPQLPLQIPSPSDTVV
jgi:CRISPR-associated protein (TIGR02710 family)